MPAKGDGITKRKDGRYVGRYTVHTADGPKRKVIYARKYKDVEKKLAEARGDAARGIVFDAKGETLGKFLERWLEDVVKPNKTHRTYASHRQQTRSHIIPALGRVKPEALRKAHVDRLYADLLRPKPKGAGLAASSVRRVHAVLHAALEKAVRGDLIPRNPAAHANKPKVGQEEIEPLDAAREDRYEVLYTLCLMARLRQGEALGLKWSDIDLDAGILQVNRQLQRVRRDGEKSGTLVFTTTHGGPLEAQNVVNRHFKPLLRRAGPPRSASTISGIHAYPCSPSAASPSATSRLSRATPPPRSSPCNATPTITTLRPSAPPTRWTMP